MRPTRAWRAAAGAAGQGRPRAEWAFPVRALVGAGRRSEISALLGEAGARRPLVVTDPGLSRMSLFPAVLEDLRRRGVEPTAFPGATPNPLDSDIERGAEEYRRAGCDSVVCIGGGSALDTGKCIAMVAESGLPLAEFDFWAAPPLLPAGGRLAPCVTVPTTAGTGAEMGSGSMYTNTQAGEKRCAGHAALPVATVLDAELTLGLPPALTAWTGMDALVHALEALFVPVYHPMCDGIALQALTRIQKHLPVAYADGANLDARAEMLVASAMAAVAFQKGLGAVHGLSEPTGAVYDTHHGLTNAVLLPFVLEDLGEVIEEHCATVAHTLRLPDVHGSRKVTAVVAWVRGLNDSFGIPCSFNDLVKLDDSALLELAQKAARNPTGYTNAVPYGEEDYARVLRAATR